MKPFNQALARAGIAILVIAAAPAAAGASEQQWTYFATEVSDTMTAHYAYVLSTDASYAFGFECDDLIGAGAFFVHTSERWDETASYAPSVPTILAVDGKTLELDGVFQGRDGVLYTYYDEMEIEPDLFQSALDLIWDASGPLEVSFFTYGATFDMTTAQAALRQAMDGCQY